MSIKQNLDLPDTGGSVRDLTSIFNVTVKTEPGGDGFTSDAAPVGATAPQRIRERKKVDGFVIFLYVLLAAGIAGIGWLTFMLFTPAPITTTLP